MKKSSENSIAHSNLNNSNFTGFNSSNYENKNKNKITSKYKPFTEAVEEYKKLCQKSYASVSNNFISVLKQENLNIYIDNYELKEINILNKLVGSYFYFKQIVLAPIDTHKANQLSNPKQEKSGKNYSNQNEKNKEEKEKRKVESEKKAKEYIIVQGIAKNLFMTESVQFFKIQNLNLRTELAEFLSEGIVNNKTLKSIVINCCNIQNDSYEILLKSILEHETIENLDLSGNSLNDKCGSMIGRIISRQTQRRDQVVWMYGLRNEKPINNDYTKGLISINLSNNNFSDISADDISNALSNDSYIRSLNLSQNEISSNGCKKLIKILRRNVSILNLDIRNNPGYDGNSNIHKRLVVKLSQNLKILHDQFISEVYTKKEFDYIKKFVNYEFFNIEIPEHIYEVYYNREAEIANNQFSSTNKEALNKEESVNIEGRPSRPSISDSVKRTTSLEERRKRKKESKEPSRSINVKKYEDNSNEDINENFNIPEIDGNFINYSDTEVLPVNNSYSHKRLYKMFTKLKEQNQSLFYENLQIRKQMLALRAQLLQNNGTRRYSMLSNSVKDNNTNNTPAIINNNSNVDDINNPNTQSLTQQHFNLSLTGTNNNINISANPKIRPMTGEEGSYEAYYFRVENLMSELTRIMDNMETNMRRAEN